MERRLKERLVGATILAVLIVLVVPELLSGPKRAAAPASNTGSPDPMRSVTVDLTTRRATAADDATGAAASAAPSAAAPTPTPLPLPSPPAADATPPADVPSRPTISTLKAQPSDTAPKGPPAETALEKPPASPNAAAMTSSSHGWAVQIGSFASHANADKAVRHLKTLDSTAYVSPTGSGASQRFRVRIGPFAERGAAEKALTRLKKDGETASLVSQ